MSATEMAKVDAMARTIRDALGQPRVDWLGRYRSWLDRHGIPAEGEDGWPTPEAYDGDTLGRFIREHTESPDGASASLWDATGRNALALFRDGDQWCVLLGPDLMAGESAFGPTPGDALRAFADLFDGSAFRCPSAAAPNT